MSTQKTKNYSINRKILLKNRKIKVFKYDKKITKYGQNQGGIRQITEKNRRISSKVTKLGTIIALYISVFNRNLKKNPESDD